MRLVARVMRLAGRPLTGRITRRRGTWRTGPQWYDYVVPYGAMLLGMAIGTIIALLN